MELKSLGDKLDSLHNTVTQKVEAASKDISAKVTEEVKAATIEIEKKAEEKAKITLDEVEKLREEWKQREAKAATQFNKQEAKAFNDILKEELEKRTDDIMKFARKEVKHLMFDFEGKAVGDMLLSSSYTGGSVMTTDRRSGIIAAPRRKLHVRDIPELPKGTTDGTRFDYLKENGTGEGAITAVTEGATKPQVDLDLVEASAPVQTIAGWLRITRKMANNVPGLISFLQARLLEKLLLVEDDQLINGDGTSPNISGITDAGNFTAASGAATVDILQITQAISQLEELGRNADAVLVRPSDFWSIVSMTASGSGEFDLPGYVTFDGGQLRIAGIPVYRTTAMTVDKFIVGDFAMGAMLLQRTAPRIEFFEQDGTNVRENKITVRVEEEIAFPIFGSDYFIYGDFGNAA